MHIRFQGRLTAADSKRYILHAFHVPAGAGQMDLHFRYAPARVRMDAVRIASPVVPGGATRLGGTHTGVNQPDLS